MRNLVLLRGAMGAGKSTFIKDHDLEQFTLSADNIRLLFQTPVQTESGKMAINSKNDGRVWQLLMNLLEERMKRGEFTVIDATHAKQEMISQYKTLCQKYRYRCTVVDFSDVSLETLLEQNKMRGEHKHVPDHVIMNAHERMQTEGVPKWVKVIKPHEFEEEVKYTATDYTDRYDRIHHIGDIHGSFDALMEYFYNTGHTWGKDGEVTKYPDLNDNELYIFVGDILDRGTQNQETLKFFLSIHDKHNVAIVEGNHEAHIWRWANDEESRSKEFVNHTQPELEEGLSQEEIEMLKKESRQLYRRLRQVVYYTYHDKEVIVTHGGIAKLPDNLLYIATEQFIKGVGNYEVDIDNAWDSLLPKKLSAEINKDGFKVLEHNGEVLPTYQIHGHRNIFRLPVQASKYSYNLEGQVEMGGNLRAVTLTKEGFETHEIKNNNYWIRKGNTPSTVNEADMSIDQFIEYLSNHNEIVEKDLGNNIYSYNFSRNAFQDKIWDDINVKARGLFINKNTKEIVSRSYNKFFNVNERSFTKINALADNLVFPVQVYDKPNGYLGILGYDRESDELIFSSKSTVEGDHAAWFKELFYESFGQADIDFIKHYIRTHDYTLTFEVILTEKDPHIIEYDKDKLVLLDAVKRQVVYEKMSHNGVKHFSDHIGVECKKLLHTFDNWADFYNWYRVTTTDFSIEEEGYVIEDASGFMTKIKLPYYNFWKQFRGIKDKFARKHEHTIKGGSLYTPLHNKVFKWMKGQDREWLKQSDIITVRKAFEADTNAKESAN